MADTGSLPTGDAAVFALLEMFALAFAFEGTSSLLANGFSLQVGFAYVAAISLFLSGLKWRAVRTRLAGRFAASIEKLANDGRVWFLVLILVFVYIGTPGLLTQLKSSRSNSPLNGNIETAEHLHGTADIPARVFEATIKVPVALPYTVHGLTADWNSSVAVTAKQSGSFSVAFNEPSPVGGGALDWEVIPRAGTHSVAVTPTDVATVTPTATPTPKPWQSFAENLYAGQVFAHEIQQNPIPGPHTISIVATDASHQFAKMLLGWLQGSWTIIAHGQPDAFIGEPSEYALDDGITIRARAGSVDAETLRLAFRVMGLNVHRVILPDSDTRSYPIVEIGNVPADQR